MTEPRDLFVLTPLRQAQLECEAALLKLEKLFKPGCRLTLIMRTPGQIKAEIMWSKDNLVEVISTINRFRLRSAIEDSGESCPGGKGCECCCSGCGCGCRNTCPVFIQFIRNQVWPC